MYSAPAWHFSSPSDFTSLFFFQFDYLSVIFYKKKKQTKNSFAWLFYSKCFLEDYY